MSRRLPEAARLVLTLTAAGLFSGLAIVAAYRTTLPTITAQQAAALRRAVLQVLPGSEAIERLVWRDGRLVSGDGGAADEQGGFLYAGYAADGRFVGYAIPAAGPGFQDTIRLIYGFDPARRTILGMAVLESRETPGLGDRIYKDPHFVAEFQGLTVDPRVELVKGHGEAANQVDAITGATISSTAVVRIVNQADEAWLSRLPPPGQEPPLTAQARARLVRGSTTGGPVPGGRGDG